MCNKFSVITEENIKCTTTSSLIIQCLHSLQWGGGGGGGRGGGQGGGEGVIICIGLPL